MSKIFPGINVLPVSVISLPIDSIAIIGGLKHRTLVSPKAASVPISGAPNVCLVCSIVSPVFMSEPFFMIFMYGAIAVYICNWLSTLSVSSSMITAFAPSGMGAPVTISIASPLAKTFFGCSPVSAMPEMLSVIGWFSSALNVSSALTAYPSTVERLKAGTSIVDITFSLSTRLYASRRATSSSSICAGLKFSSIIFLASSSVKSLRNIKLGLYVVEHLD